MVPTSRAVGLLKYLRKCGPVMTPDMTLAMISVTASYSDVMESIPLIIAELTEGQ